MEWLVEFMKERRKNIPRITIDDFLEMEKRKNNDKYLINVRGANGTGKSSFAIRMLVEDKGAYMLTENGKDVVTVFPKFKMLSIGKYFIKTGGADSSEHKDKFYTKSVIERLWDCGHNIFLEGIIVSSSYGFWHETFQELMEKGGRRVMIMNLVMPLEKLEERVKIRNGGKDINMRHVKGKQSTVKRNIKKFEDDGYNSWVTSTEGVEFDGITDWFFKEIKEHSKGVK